MKELQTFDVLVVGAGPGGATAAKRCADRGLQTVLVEKKKLPRDKVCSGMVMGKWALEIIEKEFGKIPRSVLTDPPLLAGHRFYVGPEIEDLEWPTPFSWRKDLDFFMVQGAVKSGAVLQDGVRVARMDADDGFCRIELHKEGTIQHLRARFVIGADGASSVIRRCLFPDLKVRFSGPIRECYQGQLDLPRDFFHWFFPKKLPRPRFNVNHKGDVFLIEGSGLKELRQEIGESLSPYGFDPSSKPIRKDGCTIALLHDDLLSGAFNPANGNVLLTGDAAGLILPITFEGIGSALKSGILAADAVVGHFDDPDVAASSYIESLKPMLKTIEKLCKTQEELKTTARLGAGPLAKALCDAYRETLTIQEG
ncbi:FAD binding domain protein [delta proteobacterium NaphS2]|nr:FAD binding domain protein [delta proteobacterium NaphS2]